MLRHRRPYRTYRWRRLAAALLTLLAMAPGVAQAQAGLVGKWTFDSAAESTGNWGPVGIEGNARISGGVLTVTPQGWARAGSYAGPQLGDKTLITWIRLANAQQYAGSGLSLRDGEDHFDAVVYAERQSRRWMAGSDYFRRTQDFSPGTEHAPGDPRFRQVAIAYRDLGNGQQIVGGCLDGKPLGTYTTGSRQTFAADANALFGPRHVSGGNPVGALDARITEAQVYDRALSCEEAGELTHAVDLVGQWTFDSPNDSAGNWNAVSLQGDATISNGELRVSPAGWAAADGYRGPQLGDKTLITWVRLDGAAQYAGSALSLRDAEERFDAVVYAERQSRRWMAGSDYFQRTQDFSPGAEHAPDDPLFRQVAISYRDVGYGAQFVGGCLDGVSLDTYTTGSRQTFTAGATALFGPRHLSGQNPVGALDARITEARVYSRAMTCAEAASVTRQPVFVGDSISVSGSRDQKQSLPTGRSCRLTQAVIRCWGRGANPPPGRFSQFSDGGAICGVELGATGRPGQPGAIACTGAERFTGAEERRRPIYTQVAVSTNQICALVETGEIICWQPPATLSTPLPGPPSGRFSAISVGTYHGCGIRVADQSVACWGQSFASETCAISGGDDLTGFSWQCRSDPGTGSTTPPAGRFRQVSTSTNYSCGVTVESELHCWGRLPLGVPQSRLGPYRQVSAGAKHACAVTGAEQLLCWGYNNNGPDYSAGLYGEAKVPAGRFAQVAAGDGAHTCAIRTNGSVSCFGSNLNGQLGQPAAAFARRPGLSGYSLDLGSDATSLRLAPDTSPSRAMLFNGDYVTAYVNEARELCIAGGPDAPYCTRLQVEPGTSPSVAASPQGGYAVAYQVAGSRNLGFVSPTSNVVTDRRMAPGTSPSVTAALGDSTYLTAYQSADSTLVIDTARGPITTGARMATGASPAIAAHTWLRPAGDRFTREQTWQVAYEHESGQLRTLSSPGDEHRDIGGIVLDGTSPSITAVPFNITTETPRYMIAYRDSASRQVRIVGPGEDRSTGSAAQGATSPTIGWLATGGYQVAFNAPDGRLSTFTAAGGVRTTDEQMVPGTSPSLPAQRLSYMGLLKSVTPSHYARLCTRSRRRLRCREKAVEGVSWRQPRQAAVTLRRGRVVYATGWLTVEELRLYRRRAVPNGRYALTVRYPRGRRGVRRVEHRRVRISRP